MLHYRVDFLSDPCRKVLPEQFKVYRKWIQYENSPNVHPQCVTPKSISLFPKNVMMDWRCLLWLQIMV